MAFKKVHYTISNSHPKLVVKNYFSSTAAQNSRTFQVLSRTHPVFKHLQGPTLFSSIFKDPPCFQVLPRTHPVFKHFQGP